jgi:hypothetical protein
MNPTCLTGEGRPSNDEPLPHIQVHGAPWNPYLSDGTPHVSFKEFTVYRVKSCVTLFELYLRVLLVYAYINDVLKCVSLQKEFCVYTIML